MVEAALKAGVDMVNDIWGFKYDAKIAELVAKYQVPCCIMHNREKAEYRDFLKEVIEDLEESIKIAQKAGVLEDKMILDPGIGFGKTYEQNLSMMHHLEILKKWGYPILLAASRKSVIGNTLELPTDQRVPARQGDSRFRYGRNPHRLRLQ